jgi:hypothetical protein
MPRLKAFLHDVLVNEHSVGFSLKPGFTAISRRRRIQALTVKEEVRFLTPSIRVAPRESKLSSLVISSKGLRAFCIFFFCT